MLDVIITSICRKTIERTLNSFQKNVHYSGNYRFLVNIDVKNEYYLHNLINFLHKNNIDNYRINYDISTKLRGLTEAITFLYSQVVTDYYFNLEDDWIFHKKINLDRLIDLMDNNEIIHHIRFNKERTKNYTRLYYLSNNHSSEYILPNEEIVINDINLVKTYVWSFNPSLVRTSVMKQMLPITLNENSEKHFCLKYSELFFSSGTYILGKIGDPPIVSDIGRNKFVSVLKKIKKILLLTKQNKQSYNIERTLV